ncbi:MAG: ATP-binding protein, partial [Gemmatimonadales bacterium]
MDPAYLVVDLGITAAALVLFVIQATNRIDSESASSLGVAAVLLLGVNVAVIRGPSLEQGVSFLWLAISISGVMVTNISWFLFGETANLPPILMLMPPAAALLSAEAMRLGWRWPWTRGTVEGVSPVPWLAVLTIAAFLLKLGVDQSATDLGPVLISAVVAMGLLFVRQAITMKHNADLLAERAQLAADTKIAAMVRHTSDVILVADRDLVVRYASPSAEALWGRPATELLNSHLVHLFDQVDRTKVAQLLAERLARPGQTDSGRWRLHDGQNGARRVEAVVVSLLHEPSVEGVVVTVRDQTERIQLEEQLQQSQKMEAVGQLAGGVAHDFNNLLTTILGHSEVAIGMLDEEHPVREDLTQIKRAGDMAAALTKQLLAFSRKQVIEPRIIEVAAPIARVAQLLKRLIKEDVKVTVDVPDGLGTVRVDPIQLEQAVLNLAINARDAMPSGGRLTIRATRTATPQALGGTVVLPAPPGDCIVVSVTDTGTGMDVATQSRIFEPFFTTKPAGRGTGLGLATVYGVVKQSGAGLSLISAPGEGSAFAIAFGVVQQVA